MPGVFVVTDSSCDLEHDDIDPFYIGIVPLTIRFGSEEFTDRQDLQRRRLLPTNGGLRRPPPDGLPRRPVRLNRLSATQETLTLKPWFASPSPATCQPHFSQPSPRPPRSRASSSSM